MIGHITEQSPSLGGGTIDGLNTYTLDWGAMKWTVEAVLPDGNTVSGVTGRPAYIESDFGNYEVIVPQGNHLAHYWRDNTAPNRPWYKGLPDIPLLVSPTFQWVPDSISFFKAKSSGADLAGTVISRFSCTSLRAELPAKEELVRRPIFCLLITPTGALASGLDRQSSTSTATSLAAFRPFDLCPGNTFFSPSS